MHTLFLLTAVLSSLSPALDAPMPARLDGPPAVTRPGVPRRTLHLLDKRPPEDDERQSTGGRIVAELLAGVGTTAGLVWVSNQLLSDDLSPQQLVASGLLIVLGTSAGVARVGKSLDGRGSFESALLGSFIGFVTPVLVGTFLLLDCELEAPSQLGRCGPFVMPLAVAMGMLPAAGATLGYEASAPMPWLSQGHASSTPPPTLRFVPVLTLASKGLGVTVGIAGSL